MTDAMLYHGCRTEADGHSILSEGLIHPGNTRSDRGRLHARTGRVYLSQDIATAVGYAVFGWPDVPHHLHVIHDRYAYIFAVKKSTLGDLEPDEDCVGKYVQDHSLVLGSTEIAFKPTLGDVDERYEVYERLRRLMTHDQFYEAALGVPEAQASGGKRALKRLSKNEKESLIRWGANVSHLGSVYPSYAWQLDKKLSPQLQPNASNFFDLAKPRRIAKTA